MSKIYRNMSTPEAREFWNTLERRVAEDDFIEKNGCSQYIYWLIRWRIMWEAIGLCASETKINTRKSRWHYLEVD